MECFMNFRVVIGDICDVIVLFIGNGYVELSSSLGWNFFAYSQEIYELD